MAGTILLTSESSDPAAVLPGLALLTLEVETAPLTASALAMNLEADTIILDGRRDLVSARSLCRAATGAMEVRPFCWFLKRVALPWWQCHGELPTPFSTVHLLRRSKPACA